MSPKEQAAAAKLLRRWLEQVSGQEAVKPLKEWAAELDQLVAETKSFIEHEDPDA
jgi:hypothetical protein